MDRLLLDFRECIEDSGSTWGGTAIGYPGMISSPRDPEFLYQQIGWCPYCEAETPEVFKAKYYRACHDQESNRSIEAWACDGCGWWQIKEHIGEVTGYEEHCITEHVLGALVRTFRVDDLRLPLDCLQKELTQNPRLMHYIHPRKMEELVQGVFSDFYACEVEHCGRSHDGGIDLLIIQSNSPVLVQVKRRQSEEHVESVAAVREFLGALLLKGGDEGIFVTTADHFSSAARESAKIAIKKELVRRFDLIDFARFLAMLRVTRSQAPEFWRDHLPAQDWSTERQGSYHW